MRPESGAGRDHARPCFHPGSGPECSLSEQVTGDRSTQTGRLIPQRGFSSAYGRKKGGAFPSAERRGRDRFCLRAVPVRNTLFARSDGCIGAGRPGWRHDAKLNEGWVLSGRAGGVFPTSSTMLSSGIRAGVFIVRAGDGRQKHAGRKADSAESLSAGIRPEERSAFPSAKRRGRDRFCLRAVPVRNTLFARSDGCPGQGGADGGTTPS